MKTFLTYVPLNKKYSLNFVSHQCGLQIRIVFALAEVCDLRVFLLLLRYYQMLAIITTAVLIDKFIHCIVSFQTLAIVKMPFCFASIFF